MNWHLAPSSISSIKTFLQNINYQSCRIIRQYVKKTVAQIFIESLTNKKKITTKQGQLQQQNNS